MDANLRPYITNVGRRQTCTSGLNAAPVGANPEATLTPGNYPAIGEVLKRVVSGMPELFGRH